MRKRLVVAKVLGSALGLLPGAGASWAASASYVWSVDGSPQHSGLPAGIMPGVALGPNVSATRTHARIEIGGEGRLSPKGRWVDGGGDFRIVDRNGKVLETGRWKPTRLDGFRDLGTEPEGSPVTNLRAGRIALSISLQGVGPGQLTFYCHVHEGGAEVEGVRVTVGKWRFATIEQGSTTLVRQ